jgi:glutathione-regulated potassium-efflux system ancillary protein KefG
MFSPQRPPLILVQFAHPYSKLSRVNRALLEAIADLDAVMVNDLYERYPDFHIDILVEQQLLLAADLIVLQHPFYWYSAPAMLKHWQDLVLGHGFAYGREGNALAAKKWLSVVTTGHPAEAYGPGGADRFTMEELLRPYEQTAHHCGMSWQPPLLVHGARRLTPQQLDAAAAAYRQRLLQYLPPVT